MSDPSTIINYQKKRSQEKYDITLSLIKNMIESNEILTFYSIAKRANVSVQFLYKNIELRELIMKNRVSPDHHI